MEQLGVVLALLAAVFTLSAASSPNIIFILVDDLGYYDTGLTNPEAITPTLSRLAAEGAFLNQSYVQPLCTPSRSAILTGKYPFTIGMQNRPIGHTQPKCLNTSLTLLPQKLQELGYATHAIGKWHLGSCNVACTPTRRGFDTFFGFHGGSEDHYTRFVEQGGVGGIDFHENEQPSNHTWGPHSSDLFSDRAVDTIIAHDQQSGPMFVWLTYSAVHTPLQAPAEWERMYEHIDDASRRTVLAMASHMDDGVRRVVSALEENNMADNTLLVWMSDNGGAPREGGYNYPLRGAKSTLWEGGVRSQTVLWGGALQKTEYVNAGLMHAVDWFPSLVSLAGGDTDDIDMDGVDNSAMLVDGAGSGRDVMVYEINELADPYKAAIRVGKYKLLLGDIGNDDWSIPPELTGVTDESWEGIAAASGDRNDYYFPEEWDRSLYDLEADPEERVDLIDALPEVAEELERLLAEYEEKRVPAINPASTPDEANPDLFGGFWSPGWC